MKKKNTNTQKEGYGLLSMMAMIIGIVIGSGIFIKNQDLIGINGSFLLTMISWMVAALMVVTILIAFFEIISITEITNEQSTMANWGRHLYGIKFGKVTGYFFSLVYFPMIIAALFLFSGQQFYGTLSSAGVKGLGNSNSSMHFAIIVGISSIFGGIVLVINAISSKPGKYFQNIGTALKTIPLFFVIVLLIVMLCFNADKINFQTPPKPDSIKNTNSLLLIFMTMPSMLFAFDGFILAGSLSKEAKNKGTFKTAFLISMLFIIVVYILFSVSVFGLSDISKTDTYGTISNVIINIFPQNISKILAPLISSIVLISILTGVSGCTISASRMLSDLSMNNSVLDKNGELINKNKAGVSVSSGFILLALSLLWFIIMIIFDGTVFALTDGTKVLPVAGYVSNLVVIGGFAFYSMVIIGGLINRFTNKVKVKKTKMFIPAAIFASLSTIIITLYFAWTTIVPTQDILNDHNERIAFFAQLSMFIIFIVYFLGIVIFNLHKTNKISKEILDLKSKKTLKFYKNTNSIVSDISKQ